MNFINKSNKDEDYYMKKKGYRNPLRKKINHQFDEDLILYCHNPFSQQLSPWNGNSKLEASTNLPKQQAQTILPFKNKPPKVYEPAISHMIPHNSIDSSGLFIRRSRQQQKKIHSRYTCPKFKIRSQSVIISKDKKQQVKRLLFHRQSMSDNKKTQKIANLVIQWDEDIIYNPEKKYFNEQYLKRKIIRQFSQSRNQSRHSASRKERNGEQKTFKLEFKNNRIHRKQVAVFQIKKFENSLRLSQKKSKSQKKKQGSELTSTHEHNRYHQIQNHVKISNLVFQPAHQNAEYSTQQSPTLYERGRGEDSAKRKFRSSLQSKELSLQKKTSRNLQRFDSIDKKISRRQQMNRNEQKDGINKISLQSNRKVRQDWVPFKIMTKTFPDFCKKTIQ